MTISRPREPSHEPPRASAQQRANERSATPEAPKSTACAWENASRGAPQQRVADNSFALQIRRSERTGAPEGAKFHNHSRLGRRACEERPTWRFQAENISNGRQPVELMARVICVCESDRHGLTAL